MSQLGQSRHFDGLPMTSGLPPETDIVTAGRHVSNVPKAEVAALVRSSRRHGEHLDAIVIRAAAIVR